MRERGKIAAGADRAAAGDDRVHPRVERRDQRVERRATHAGVALGEHIRAQRHHRADRGYAQRRVDAGRVAPEQVTLQRGQRGPRDLDFGERAEAGVDTVGGVIAGGGAIDNRARGIDGGCGAWIERHGLEAVCDGFKLLEGQGIAGETHHVNGE